jgi:diguanylate cyclase (GGDEF)-like protein
LRWKRPAVHIKKHFFCFWIAFILFPCLIPLPHGIADTGENLEIRTVNITSQTSHVPLGYHLQYIEDRDKKITITDLLDDGQRFNWQESDVEVLNFGFTKSVYWFRFQIINTIQTDINHMLQVGYPLLDKVEIFIIKDGKIDKQIATGDKNEFSSRIIPHRTFLIPFESRPNETLTFYLKIKTTSSLQVPLYLWEAKQFFIKDLDTLFIQGLFIGIMLVMILYNIFIFFSVREKSYFYYVVYVFFFVLLQGSLHGLTYKYIWPNALHWNDISIAVIIPFTLIWAILFTQSFLELKKESPTLNTVLNLLIIICILGVILAFYLPYFVTIRLSITITVVCVLMACFVGIKTWLQGVVTARFFVIAWTTLLISVLLYCLNKFGFIPRNYITENAMQIGMVLEVILLSLALADRLNSNKKEIIEAQKVAIENERLALDIQKTTTEMLEVKVGERTQELEIALTELSSANKALKEISTVDGLTNVKNRRYFDTQLEIEFRRCIRSGNKISLMMIDIDHFKKFNDEYGHLAGDECLRLVAGTIQSSLQRAGDLVARYGGEEFVVLLPNSDMESAIQMAEKIRQTVYSTRITVNKQETGVAVSVGVSCCHCETEHPIENLIKKADDALYRAKREGKNRVAY